VSASSSSTARATSSRSGTARLGLGLEHRGDVGRVGDPLGLEGCRVEPYGYVWPGVTASGEQVGARNQLEARRRLELVDLLDDAGRGRVGPAGEPRGSGGVDVLARAAERGPDRGQVEQPGRGLVVGRWRSAGDRAGPHIGDRGLEPHRGGERVDRGREVAATPARVRASCRDPSERLDELLADEMCVGRGDCLRDVLVLAAVLAAPGAHQPDVRLEQPVPP
jgi:hypothetical protein